jgi:adenylate kinase family enzyme
MIIHISGSPGSGKTTLGEKINTLYGNKIIVYDTDDFIQHHNKAGQQLLQLEKTATIEEYKQVWEHILDVKIKKFIDEHPNKIIIFTGILDNFSPDGTIYPLKADVNFMIDLPLHELLKRYYFRICVDDKKRTRIKSNDYWNKVAQKIYRIDSSQDIIDSNQRYIKWHTENGYKFANSKEIIAEIKNIIKYFKYKNKYDDLKSDLTN